MGAASCMPTYPTIPHIFDFPPERYDLCRKNKRADHLCLRIRSQPLCFAVARIFMSCVRIRTMRRSIRRIFDRSPPRYPTAAEKKNIRRPAGERFFVKTRRKSAGILSVFPAFATMYWRKISAGAWEHGACVGTCVRILPSHSAYLCKRCGRHISGPQGHTERNTPWKGRVSLGNCVFPHHHPVPAADRGSAAQRQAADR